MRSNAKRGAVVAGVSVLVAGVAMWPSGAGADSGKDGKDGRGQVLSGAFVSEREEYAFIDNDGNARVSTGDEFVYTNSGTSFLGKGTEFGHCVFHQVDATGNASTMNCTQTSETDRGSLTFQGILRITLVPQGMEPTTWAVTGGTGDFEKARGSVDIDRAEGTELDYRSYGTLRIVLRP